jgi:hypothetical protein
VSKDTAFLSHRKQKNEKTDGKNLNKSTKKCFFHQDHHFAPNRICRKGVKSKLILKKTAKNPIK